MARPTHCRPEAFELFRTQIPAIETTPALVRAAIAVSLHEHPDRDPVAVEEQLDLIGITVAGRVRTRETRAYLAHLHHHLFEELDFRGDEERYDDPANSYLPMVIETRRGLPILLSLLYKAVAERVGLTVHGINAPAHFMVGVRERGRVMIVDPFAGGRTLSRDEAFERISRAAGRPVPRTDALLREASHRQWIARILRNLANSFHARNRLDDLRAINELLGLL